MDISVSFEVIEVTDKDLQNRSIREESQGSRSTDQGPPSTVSAVDSLAVHSPWSVA
jgi:hypothetical protein